jgi:hypothetical protein
MAELVFADRRTARRMKIERNTFRPDTGDFLGMYFNDGHGKNIIYLPVMTRKDMVPLEREWWVRANL